jgi:hypothetical protein
MSEIQISPEADRFIRYVEKTTRPQAQEKRRSMLSHLLGHQITSAVGLAAAVGGNTKDQAWISQAMKDGEITKDEAGGFLRLPNPRGTSVVGGTYHLAKQIAKACGGRIHFSCSGKVIDDGSGHPYTLPTIVWPPGYDYESRILTVIEDEADDDFNETTDSGTFGFRKHLATIVSEAFRHYRNEQAREEARARSVAAHKDEY